MDNKQKNLTTGRVLSIDALRGFDMFWITGGGALLASLVKVWDNRITNTIATQLEHVEWQGFRLEDLIFPLFIFLMGVVMPYSICRRIEKGHSRPRLYLHILKRTTALILIGLIMNGLLKFDFPNMRWPGVLQRIALCYFFAALIVLNTRWRTQAIIIAVVLILYCLVSSLVPAPGSEPGDLTMEGCLSSYIDQQLIPGRLYYTHGDNEGIISTFPAVCTALLGALAGHWLRSNRTGPRKAAGLALAGLASLAAGYIWSFFFPIIKILWTSSYVLVAAGLSLLLLAAFYYIIDVKGCKKWAFFFIVIGVNPITIYFAQSFINFNQISAYFLTGLANHAGQIAPLIIPLGALTARWLFLYFLYRHRVFLKL